MQYHLEATYEDGFKLIEDEVDKSPYDEGRNVFHAILNKRPEEAHGRLVQLSLIGSGGHFDIDFTALPDNARPIRFKHMERDFDVDAATGAQTPISEARMVGIDFGYQYNDENGKNVQEVIEVK